MQTCPNCNHLNRPGVVFCDNCGASLIGDAPLGTKNFGQKQGDNLTNVPLNSLVSSAGSDLFSQGTVLRIEIEGSEPMVLKPQQETIFGRRDPATGEMPDVDLTPFAGYRMGVSRRHAAIRRTEGDRLDLWDLGSSNGTFLNGTRLAAHRPNKIHDGDQIRLGQMLIKVYFLPIPANLQPNQAISTPPPANGNAGHKDNLGSETTSGTGLSSTAALKPAENPAPSKLSAPAASASPAQPANPAPTVPPSNVTSPAPNNPPSNTAPAVPANPAQPTNPAPTVPPPSPAVSSTTDSPKPLNVAQQPGGTNSVPPSPASPNTPANDTSSNAPNSASSGNPPTK